MIEVERDIVLFIGGAGRSGSTLIENVLANSSEMICVGELKMIWENGLAKNLLTPQGVPFLEDKFWKEVFNFGWGGSSNVDVSRVLYLQRCVDRTLLLPLNEVSLFCSSRRKALIKEYVGYLSILYNSIKNISGKKIIVDSTKWPIYFWFINRIPEIDVRCLHLVRDPRAVALSWKQPKRRPETGDNSILMMEPSHAWIFLKWIEANMHMSGIRRITKEYALLRYEDFVADPKKTLAEAFCDMKFNPNIIDKLIFENLKWGLSHSMQGNPVRFKTGVLNISIDERWKSGLSAYEKIIIRILAEPLMRLYGY